MERGEATPWLKRIALWILLVLAATIILVTLASAIPSNQWWIRVWDFPRLIILTAGGFILAAFVYLRFRWWWAVSTMLAAALIYQTFHIIPYTILRPVEARKIEIAGTERETHCFTALSLNVLQTNRDYQRTLDLIEREDPDLLLLMETDGQWQGAMEPVLATYPHRFDAPLSNTYGMIFATRLATEKGRILNLTEAGTPSIHAQITTRGGQRFRFVALHPRPPHPGQDTEERDAEIAIAAMMTRRIGMPTLTMGDFNDVGWSETSQLFRRLGGYIDPRVGRGFYATFPAGIPAFRWPLDHVFFTEDFAIYSLGTGTDVGSDHLPVRAEICLVPDDSETRNNPAEAESDDLHDVKEVMEAYREDQIEERQTGAE